MKRRYILPIFLFIQIIFLKIIRYFPELVERFYSNGVYVYISKFSRIVWGKIPFSIGDCLYFILIVLLIKWFWNKRKIWTRGRAEQSGAKSDWKNNLISVLSVLSIFYFFFHILWALNYYREPLFEKMKIERDYTDADLLTFTKKLIAKTNAIQSQITKNDSLKVVVPYSQNQVFEMNQNGYKNLSKEYPFFNYSNSSIKKSLFSLPLTYMGFGGYLNPFTNEAQVNYLGPMYSFPMTTNHEMAHQMGYASESECNFIGFLAGIKNKDLYFQYAAYSSALRYCLGNVAENDEAKFNAYKPKTNLGIIKNFRESELFWNQYDTFIDKGFHAFYDHYLKANQQQDGLESYSKFVDLLINYYKGKELR